jgi:hypothetical protein
MEEEDQGQVSPLFLVLAGGARMMLLTANVVRRLGG